MTAAQLSLLALIAALGLSMTSRINVGWIALALAWLIGVYRAGMRPDAVMAGFPASLFITLTGVTLLFAMAETNLTLSAVATRVIRAARGSARLVPLLMFAIACVLSSVGPGAIATVALLAPLAMTMGDRAGIPALLTALMIANGANAGNLSPFSAVGIIANGAMAKAGLAGHEWRVWFANFIVHVVVAVAAYAWLTRRTLPAADPGGAAAEAAEADWIPLTPNQKLTLAVVGAWVAGVLGFQVHLGLSAFAAAVTLILLRAADEAAAVRRVPWSVIMMVCGVSVLIAVLEKTGGMELFTALLARASSVDTVNGVLAFVTGAISTYSSTSGVVLPAFLPTIPGIVDQLGGGDPLEIALSINVGSSLVDVSPLSTLGALCVAAVPGHVDASALFRALLIWGLSMTVVGAVVCQLFAGLLAG